MKSAKTNYSVMDSASASSVSNVDQYCSHDVLASNEESYFIMNSENRKPLEICSSTGTNLIDHIRLLINSYTEDTSVNGHGTDMYKRQIEEALEELGLRIASINELKEKICEQHVDSQSLLQVNKSLEKKCALLRNDLDLSKKSEQWYKQQLHKSQSSKAEALKDNFYLKKSIIDLETQLDKVSLEKDKVKREYENVKGNLKQVQMRVKELEITYKSTKPERDRTSENITQQYYESVIQELGSEIVNMRAVVEEQQEEFVKYNKENAELLSRFTVMQKTLTEKECLIEQLQMQNSELHNKFTLNTDLLNDLKRLNSSLINEKEEAEIKLIAVNQEKYLIQSTLNKIRQNFNKVIESQNKLKSELREKEKIISDYQCQKQQDFMDKNWKICAAEELKHNSTEIENLHREIESLNGKLALLKEENTEFARLHSNSLIKISKLESTIDYLQGMLLESENKYKNAFKEKLDRNTAVESAENVLVDERNMPKAISEDNEKLIFELNNNIAALQEECKKRQCESERLQREIAELHSNHTLDMNQNLMNLEEMILNILQCVTDAFLQMKIKRELPICFPDNCYRVKSCESVIKNLEAVINDVFKELYDNFILMKSQQEKLKNELKVSQDRNRYFTEKVVNICAKSNRINRKIAISYKLLRDVYDNRPVELLDLIREYEKLKRTNIFEDEECANHVYRYDNSKTVIPRIDNGFNLNGNGEDNDDIVATTIRPLNGKLVEKTPSAVTPEIKKLNTLLQQYEEQNQYLTNEIKLLTSAYHQKAIEASDSHNKTIHLKATLDKTETKLQTVMDTLQKDMQILENDLNSVKNEKYFLQRLCSDLKLALRSSTSHCHLLNERLAEKSQTASTSNALPDVPNRLDEGHVRRLLEESVSVPVVKSLSEVQVNLDSLKREFALLQQQINEKTLCCL